MRRLHLFLLALALPVLPAHAPYTVGKLLFNGASPDQAPALGETIRLKPGQSFSAADLQTAAQRLSDTGAFDDVQVALDGPAAATTIAFALKPIPPSALLLASFQNFYWFTPAELQAALRKRVPLLGTSQPEAGNLIEAVQTALEALLRERSIPATVRHDISEPSAEQQARVVTYSVINPGIVVGDIHLSGVAPQFAKDVQFWSSRVSGTLLNDGLEHRTTDTRLLIPYLNSGYVTAHLVDRRLTPLTSTSEKVTLSLAGTVVPGPLLRVGNVSWAGSPELSSADFSSGSSLKPGEPASLANLEKTTGLLAAPYRKEGYADAVVHAVQHIDAGAGTVSYAFDVEPGDQYRVRSIKTVGLTPGQQSDYNRAFAMKPGDLFNPDYIQHFFGKESQLASLRYDTASYRAERDPAAHLVDLVITVVKATVEAQL